MGRPRFHRRHSAHAAATAPWHRRESERHAALIPLPPSPVYVYIYARVRTLTGATVLSLVTRARHTDAPRHTGYEQRKLHPAKSAREKYKECERAGTERARKEGREKARAILAVQLGTPQIFNRHPLHPVSSSEPHFLLPALAPDPSSIRARFCRVHRQINGVANTGRYICPRPHRPRSVQSTPSRTPHPSSIPRARPIPRPSSLPPFRHPLAIPLRAILYRVIIKFHATDTDGPMNESIVPYEDTRNRGSNFRRKLPEETMGRIIFLQWYRIK